MKTKISQSAGHISSPAGFRAAGVAAGIKAQGKDLALIVSERPCTAAGVYTTNRVTAAPVQLCRQRTPGRNLRAIIVNSGNANACTGRQGQRDAQAMAQLTATQLGLNQRSILVCSTGTIGRPLPMERLATGIAQAAAQLSPAGGAAAATAIMTTDTHPKHLALQFTLDGRPITLGGMAKGAGMINPMLATMLAFLTTDAAVEAEALQSCLKTAAEQSFNRISVDGDRSTNDTILFLANGQAGNKPLRRGQPGWPLFQAAVHEATRQLARMIVKDGEGATKLVTIRVKGAPSRRAAAAVARAVANSLLVKTSWFGADPNWGRVICAVGYAGVALRPELIEIAYDGLTAVKDGQATDLAPDALREVILQPEFTIDINLHLGSSSYFIYTCDCSAEYVRINASYMT